MNSWFFLLMGAEAQCRCHRHGHFHDAAVTAAFFLPAYLSGAGIRLGILTTYGPTGQQVGRRRGKDTLTIGRPEGQYSVGLRRRRPSTISSITRITSSLRVRAYQTVVAFILSPRRLLATAFSGFHRTKRVSGIRTGRARRRRARPRTGPPRCRHANQPIPVFSCEVLPRLDLQSRR